MIDTNAFTKLVPGFDFLQNLMQGAGQAAPAMGQWIAPTLNPDELEKRISELKTLQFWLEQNARMIGMTVQALEVQRMTLSTLQTMNLPMADLRQALTLPSAPAEAPAAAAPVLPPPAAAEDKPAAKPAVDPMQWWGALTQQFTELATKAMQDGGAIAARNLAAAKAVAKPADEPAAAKKAAAARPLPKRRASAPDSASDGLFHRRPRQPSRLAHGAVDGRGAAGGAAQRAGRSRRSVWCTSPTTTRRRPNRCWRHCASAGRAWPGPAAWAWA